MFSPTVETAEVVTLNDIFAVEEPLQPIVDSLANYWPKVQLFEADYLMAEAEEISENVLVRIDVSDDFSLLASSLEVAESFDEFTQACVALEQQIQVALDESVRRFYAAAEKQRRSLYALNLAYEHGNGEIAIMPVDYGFGGSKSPYLKQFQHVLTQAFQMFRINTQQSPTHLAFLQPISSISTLKKLGKILKNNLALGFFSLPNLERNKLMNFLHKRPIVGADDSNAFLAAVAVHGTLAEINKGPAGSESLDIPLPGALAALMGAGKMGCNVFGLLNNGLAIDGIQTKWRYETEDSVLLSDHGALQVLPYGAITGVRTTYNGGVAAYGRIPSMDVFVGVNRSMAALMREYAYSTWGSNEKKAFHQSLLDYFNNLFCEGVLDGPIDPNAINIQHNEKTGRVTVSVPVRYKGVAERFTFSLVSKDGQFSLDGVALS